MTNNENTAVNGINVSLGQLPRLRLIDASLDEYGYYNRSFGMNYFGISVGQASADVQMYLQIAPHNLVYNKSERRYERAPGFSRQWK
jgi:hypothetical protein